MKKIFIFIISFFLLLVSNLSPVLATPVGGTSSGGTSMTLKNPLGDNVTVFSLTGRIISVVLGLVGTIALVMFIYGGIIWMTSAGSSDKIKKGREAIIWSVIGMAVIFASYGLTKFLLDNITGK